MHNHIKCTLKVFAYGVLSANVKVMQKLTNVIITKCYMQWEIFISL
jgi:hypothetical protein